MDLTTKEYQRQYRLANKKRLNKYSREYRKTHLQEERERNGSRYSQKKILILARQKLRYGNQKEKILAAATVYKRGRRKTDLLFRILENCRTRLYAAVKGASKSARTRELLGCSVPELKAHLEKQFRPGMTWENYGPVWHVDHIKPCARFDLSDPIQQRTCFHFSNLQPLFAVENLQKSSR